MGESILLLGVFALLAVTSFALYVLTSGIWFAGKYIAGFKDVKNFKGSMVEYSNAEPARKVVKN